MCERNSLNKDRIYCFHIPPAGYFVKFLVERSNENLGHEKKKILETLTRSLGETTKCVHGPNNVVNKRYIFEEMVGIASFWCSQK
jgi:hypothetical protein